MIDKRIDELKRQDLKTVEIDYDKKIFKVNGINVGKTTEMHIHIEPMRTTITVRDTTDEVEISKEEK